jgi:hypothetical protein
MKTPHNLEEAEELFGLERSHKRPRRPKQRIEMSRKRCLDCGKWGFHSVAASRIIISRMLVRGKLSGPDMYTFRPYLCSHGWWHIGHDPKARYLIGLKLEADMRRLNGPPVQYIF